MRMRSITQSLSMSCFRGFLAANTHAVALSHKFSFHIGISNYEFKHSQITIQLPSSRLHEITALFTFTAAYFREMFELLLQMSCTLLKDYHL